MILTESGLAKLRDLNAQHAINFGLNLLQAGTDAPGDGFTFGSLYRVARRMVDHEPDAAAQYLASLVALEMIAMAEPDPRPTTVTPN